jgi:hypothetical protein
MSKPPSTEQRSERSGKFLVIPTEPFPCWIPLGMTEENLNLLEASLKLWRERICKFENND